ncbi:ADP-ribosylglycohydrolase [Cotonvirus japonicus]|uniref:ADP-ribosylglycohydrolase n=1 Tax=Cotonvirus japonicus TaxID=2811091 RepID=A0ABM7NSN2_9VIRU|nr:ADP-ribosylglycohydrolase [Cotonvirus japonicus]BCS83097.1 ADP-ribosylglycohydrolase [Cotonvirus japonicus]
MSNNDMSKNKIPDINKSRKETTELINNYITQSRKIIYNTLVNKYNLSAKKASDFEFNINRSTLAKMSNTYRFSGQLPQNDKRGEDLDRLFTLNHPDFLDWSILSLFIPFYQSFGDTLGYYNGNWEFNYGDDRAKPDYVNNLIHEFINLGGVNDLSILNWLASDDTILYIATMQVVSRYFSAENPTIDFYGNSLKQEYLQVKPILEYRDPGEVTMDSLGILSIINWDKIPYNSRAIGAGAAMRSGSIGIFYPGSHNRKKLVELAVECSRITHNSATAILGAVVAALFTAYGLEKISINKWPHKLLKLLESNMVDNYIKASRPTEFDTFVRDKSIYHGQWKKYVNWRFSSGTTPRTDLRYMINPVERYKYLVENFSKGCKKPGACGDDCLIMAYDALLQSEGIIEKIIVYAILHPGDSDTVGSIALSWFGALYGTSKNMNILSSRFYDLEYYETIYDFLNDNWRNMLKVYYKDIYLNTANKFMKQIIKNRN